MVITQFDYDDYLVFVRVIACCDLDRLTQYGYVHS